MHSSNTLWRHLQALAKVLLLYMGALLALSLIATVAAFPWDLDPQADESASQAQANYYKTAYSPGATSKGLPAAGGADAAALSEKEAFYANFARKMALKDKVPETVRAFVDRCGLENKKILDVGAGNGLLQDIVADYTGLDISPTARRYFHKPFVEASATDMRFPSESFDGLWSVWVLEHIPNPEKALMEMRRVVKRDGYLLLYPAFDVSRYAAQGCFVRPYSDFDWKGKLVKLTAPAAILSYPLYYHQVRMLRSIGARLGSGPTRLHFTKLTPNYDQYWVADSDATTSVSFHELYLWFTTRGDACLNCPSERDLVFSDRLPPPYLIIEKRGQ